jgi:hypothetical protein
VLLCCTWYGPIPHMSARALPQWRRCFQYFESERFVIPLKRVQPALHIKDQSHKEKHLFDK